MPSALVARGALGFVFLYHGLVPKILFLSPTEIMMIEAHGLGLPADKLVMAAGVAEILLGLALIFLRSAVWPVIVALVALIILLLDIAILFPAYLVEPFNPVSTNVAAIALCIIALIQQKASQTERLSS